MHQKDFTVINNGSRENKSERDIAADGFIVSDGQFHLYSLLGRFKQARKETSSSSPKKEKKSHPELTQLWDPVQFSLYILSIETSESIREGILNKPLSYSCIRLSET